MTLGAIRGWTFDQLPTPVQLHRVRIGARCDALADQLTGHAVERLGEQLAETENGYYKAELIYGPALTGPPKTVEDVELASLGWVY
jgi:putative transposase